MLRFVLSQARHLRVEGHVFHRPSTDVIATLRALLSARHLRQLRSVELSCDDEVLAAADGFVLDKVIKWTKPR